MYWECPPLEVTGSSPSGTGGSSAKLAQGSSIQNLTNLFPLESTSVTASFPSISFTNQ